jgi:hypothetical protein
MPVQEGEGKLLSLQMANDYLGFAVSSQDQDALLALKWYGIKNLNPALLDEWFKENAWLSQSFNKIHICFDNNSNILVPASDTEVDHSPALYAAGAHAFDTTLQEMTRDGAMSNVFTIPYQVYDWIRVHFPAARIMHLKTLLVDQCAGSGAEGLLSLNFCNNTFNLVSAQSGKLLLAQTYPYSSPADVLFYLLKVCELFNLDQEKLELRLSGLLEKDSSLYREIYQYFLQVDFIDCKWAVPEPGQELPAHLFCTLNLIAQCE